MHETQRKVFNSMKQQEPQTEGKTLWSGEKFEGPTLVVKICLKESKEALCCCLPTLTVKDIKG